MLRMKNFNILSVHWKIRFLGRTSQKNDIEGGVPKKGGLGQLKYLRGLGKKDGGGVFDRGVIPWCTLYLTPSYLLKVTKFVVKIFQFEFLVMTEKYLCL